MSPRLVGMTDVERDDVQADEDEKGERRGLGVQSGRQQGEMENGKHDCGPECSPLELSGNETEHWGRLDAINATIRVDE